MNEVIHIILNIWTVVLLILLCIGFIIYLESALLDERSVWRKIKRMRRNKIVIHPGETLKEFIENNNMNAVEFSARVGIDVVYVVNVLNGKAGITDAFARKIENAFGIDSSFWINLQRNYDREYKELYG